MQVKPWWRQSGVMKKWLVIAAAVAIVFALILVVVAVMPEKRRQAFLSVVPGYNLYQVMSLRAIMRGRDFAAAAQRLDGYLDRARQVSRSRSTLLPGLVESFELVVEQARTRDEFDILLPVLERLAEMDPALHLGHLWLSRALRWRDAKKALVHANTAIALIPADDRAYREGIEAALALGSPSLVAKYCAGYSVAQFGGPLPRDHAGLFRAAGLRKMALEVRGPKGEAELVTNLGIELDERRGYHFQIPHPAPTDALVLHLGLLPGIEITIHGVRLSVDGATLSFEPAAMIVTTRTGYVRPGAGGSVTVLSIGQGDETLRLRSAEGSFPAAGRVELDLTFRRLPIASHPACGSMAAPG